MTGRIARAIQAVQLVRYAPPEIADAFCASRLDDTAGGAFGVLPAGLDVDAIVTRAAPSAVAL